MAVLYPESLPSPLAKSISVRRQDTKRRIEFDAKNSRTTNHASNAPTIIDCQFVFDAVQLDAFEYFYKFTANFGVNWIDAPWLSALGFNSHYFRFIKPSRITKNSGAYMLLSVIEIQLSSIAVIPVVGIHSTSNITASTFPPENCIFWYAADLDGMSEGDTVVSGGHVPNLVAGEDFVFRRGYGYGTKVTVGGLPALHLASYLSYVDGIASQSLLPLAEFTMIVMEHRDTVYSGSYGSHVAEGSASPITGMRTRSSGSAYIHAGSSGGSAATLTAQNRSVNDKYSTIMTVKTGEKSKYYDSGVFVGESPWTHGATSSPFIFKPVSSSGTNYVQLFECMLFDRAFTAEEVASISSILTTKWQIE